MVQEPLTVNDFLMFYYFDRDEVQHYTNQLAKDTNRMLKELNAIPLPSSQSDQVSVTFGSK